MILPLAACLLVLGAAAQEKNPDVNPHDRPKIDPARVYTFERQDLPVPDFPTDGGWILDIAGGGEGIIGRIKGAQVVAIDLYAWGMNRTPPGPLKLVMDATDLKFLDRSFGTVTSFFTLMYMTAEQQEKAVREAHRVLKPRGALRIWDVQLPVSPAKGKDIGVYLFRFQLPGEVVETGYGTSFPKSALDLPYYVRLAERAGFTVEERETSGRTFRLVARKN